MVKKYALMSPLCIKSHVHAHSRFLFQFRVGVCWPWWRTSGVQEWIPQVEGSLSWISLARSMDSLYSAIKGSLELDVLMLTHTHTRLCIHAHTCPPERLIHTLAFFILSTGTLAPFAFSPSPHFSPQCHSILFWKRKKYIYFFVSLGRLWTSPCPSVALLVLASACLLPSFSLPDFLLLSAYWPSTFL